MRFRRKTLGHYFREHYRPGALAHRNLTTRRNYGNALSQLRIFVDTDPALADVTEAMMKRYYLWLLERGVNPRAARKYGLYFRLVIRHAFPDGLPQDRKNRANGKYHRKRAAEAKERRVERTDKEWVAHFPTDDKIDTQGSLFRFLRETYVPERMVGSSPGSVEQNAVAVRRFSRQLGRPSMIEDLTDESLSGHLGWLLDQGLSRATVNSSRGSLVSLWRHAYRKKLLTELPTVEKLKEYKRLPEAWTLEELARLLQACAETPGWIGGLKACDFWQALVLVLYRTGLRRRADMEIEQSHVDLQTGWLFVPGENQKQKADQRFRLSEDAMDAIRRIWLPPRRLLFPWPNRLRRLYYRFDTILGRSGLPSTRKDKFHKIRRTTASYIAKVAGAEAAGRQLGHSGSDVTKRYIDPTIAYSKFDTTGQLPDLPKSNGNGDNGD
ncbi:MAG: phage integrase SAM-like domain-containing protein [Planctomycetota bacterium]